jgi:hypothetical protein
MNIAYLRTTALGLLLAASAGHRASADLMQTQFTWNPSAVVPGLPGSFTADSISTTDYLLNDNSDGSPFTGPQESGLDTFVMQINGFSLGGVPVTVPGLGKTFGLYLTGTAGLTGDAYGNSIYGFGSEKLVLDPTNNDGTPAATYDPVTDKLHFSVGNPAGIADDITLATGNFLDGSFGLQSNGHTGVHFQYDFTPNPAETGFVQSSTAGGQILDQLFFNTATSRVNGFDKEGRDFVLQNGGYGIDSFLVPEPASLSMLAAGLSILALGRRRKR